MGDSLVTSVQGIQAVSWIRGVQAGFPLDINVVDSVCSFQHSLGKYIMNSTELQR